MAAGGPEPPGSQGQPVAVLVVEDDDDLRGFLRAALEDDGYEVLAAPHGAAALDLVRHRPPGVVLLDLRLPVMDGPAFVRAYRRLPAPYAPVVVLTAAPDAGPRAAEVGAVALLRKPVDLDALLAVVRRHATGRGA